jgi:hypothetical protein
MAKITKKDGQSVWQFFKKEIGLEMEKKIATRILAEKTLNQPTFFKWEL